MRNRLILSIICSVVCFSVQAKTLYITDEFEVMFRTGPSTSNKIVKELRSGDATIVLEEEAGNGYSKIKLPSGTEGYVLSRFLVDQPSKKDQVLKLKEQLKSLRAKPNEVQAMLAQKQEENQYLIQQNTELTERLSSTESQLNIIKEASSNAVQLADKNVALEKERQNLLLLADDLRIQNNNYKDQSKQKWFILGASAVSFGLLLGWLLSVMRRRPRRQSGGLI